MPKITLTDKEKVTLELYINFLVHNSNPCDECQIHMHCSKCSSGDKYRKNLAKYDVTELLSYKEIEEYVASSVKLIKYRAQIQSLTDDIHNLEKKISEIMESIVLVKDSEKKTDDNTEFYCNNCETRFSVRNDKCKIAFDGEGTLEANVRKYYRCPICTKICWHND